jgi:hypothetical protein
MAMQFVMHPDMVYQYPIWAVGFLLVGAAVLGAVLLELGARRLLPIELRRQHNDVAAAIFSIIGVTYAVLLAFVAMLAWEGFNRAEAASYAEAAVLRDVYTVSVGLTEPARSSIRNDIIGYARSVVNVEWPAQADGRVVDRASVYLDTLNGTVHDAHPSSLADSNLHFLLLQSLTRLWDARQGRLLAAGTTIPGVVWFVMLLGGALTIAFGSFFGAPSLRMHLAMSATLAASGAIVLILVIALSNPFRGDFRVSTEPFDRVLSHLEQSAL